MNSNTKETDIQTNIFMQRENFVYLYSLLICLTIFFAILRSTSFMQVCINASKELYHKMSTSMLNTNMNFFFANPAGRILNRFSKDVGLMDDFLPLIILDTLQVDPLLKV